MQAGWQGSLIPARLTLVPSAPDNIKPGGGDVRHTAEFTSVCQFYDRCFIDRGRIKTEHPQLFSAQMI